MSEKALTLYVDQWAGPPVDQQGGPLPEVQPDFGFARVPLKVLADSRLKNSDKCVFAAIASTLNSYRSGSRGGRHAAASVSRDAPHPVFQRAAPTYSRICRESEAMKPTDPCECSLCLYRRGAGIAEAAEQGITVEQAVDRLVRAERK